MWPWWYWLLSCQIFRSNLWGGSERRKDGIANMTELQTAALLCEMGRAHFFQKIMCFLLYFFTVHSKCEGPTITPNSVCQHLSCDGWQSLSVRPQGTDVCSSQHPARGSALARQRCWQTSALCTAARRKQSQLPQPLQPIVLSVQFFQVSISRKSRLW